MSLVLTKIRIPQRRKDILRRQRLVDLLHNNIYRKLIFISAPAGYGKTTLLTEFANDVDAKACWYRIDRDDVDMVPYALHLIASLQQVYPAFGTDIRQALEAGGGGLDPSGLGVEIVNEMVRHVNDFTILFLDDFHLVGEKQPIVDLMETLLSYLPDQVRLIIASRSVYGIPAANLYLRSDLATIGADELRFRPEELQALIREHYSFELDADQLNELARRSDGWIIAILLAIRAMEQGIQPQFQKSSSEMYDFLAEEVVALQPEHLRKFLLQSSILDEFNEEVCNTVLEISNSGELIQELEERNLFLTRIDAEDGETNFRYHQLFNEFLSQRLYEIDPQLKAKLHRRAADWYFQRKEWERAVHHKIAAGDREEAAGWMDQFARQLFVSGRISVISDWIRNLTTPVDVRGKAPWLSLNWAKVLYERGDYVAGDQYLDIAERELINRNAINLLTSLYVIRGMGKIYQGQPKKALELAQSALELGQSNEDVDQFYRYQSLRLMGIAYRHLRNTSEAVDHLEQALEGFRGLADSSKISDGQAIHDLAENLIDLGLAHFDNGNVLEAQSYLEEVVTIRRRQKSNQAALVIALNNVGYLYYLLGRFLEAWGAYEEAYALAHSIRNHRGMVHILNSRGDFLRDLGEWKSAEASYLEARRRAESADHSALFATYIGLSELERRRGNYHDALYWLREAARIRNQNVESPDYQVGLGQVYLEMGQLEMAGKAFLQAIEHLGTHQRPNQNLSLCLFLYARVCYESGDNESALNYLERSLKTAAQLGYDQFLVIAARSTPDFLRYASNQNGSKQLFSIMQRSINFPDFTSLVKPKSAPEKTPAYHLAIEGFGPGVVSIDGEVITVSDWRSSNARGLFFFIIDREGIRKEEIALDLWPDFSQAKATSNFHSTLWRVRKALGSKDAIIFDQNKYMLHPEIEYEYDVKLFEQALDEASNPAISPKKQLNLLKKAVRLYRGDFLLDIPGGWIEQRRDALVEKYLNALNTLAKLLEAEGDFPGARQLYEQILQTDPYRDDVHLAIMQCLSKSGTPTAAKAHFQGYKEFLWRELKARPQPELQQYFDALP